MSNWPEVKKYLEAFVKVRNKSTYDVVRSKMADIAVSAARFTKYTERDKISASIMGLPNIGDTKPRKGGGQYIGQYKLINWQRKLVGMPALGGGRPRVKRKLLPGGIFPITIKSKAKYKDKGLKMAGKYKGFLKYRRQGSKWLRIGWAAAAASLGKPFSGEKGDFGPATLARITGKAYGGGSNIKISGAGKFQFEIYNGTGVFDHRFKTKSTIKLPMRPASQIANARAIQEDGLKKGVVVQIADMAREILRRTSDIWNNGQKLSSKQIIQQ